VEEERACHPAAGRVQLPIPQIGIWAGKAPGIRHFDTLGDDLNPNSPTGRGIWARSATRSDERWVTVKELTSDQLEGLPCWGRIRADPGAVDLQTLERFSSLDKTLITFFVDLDFDGAGVGRLLGSSVARCFWCVVAHTIESAEIGGGRLQRERGRLLSAVRLRSSRSFCPKSPLSGPYCRSTGVNVLRRSLTSTSVSLLVIGTSVASTPSAGGVT
jgi:hypothetical protein